MFKFGFSLLFAVLLTCDCYSSSEELIEALTEGTIEHEIANVDVENPSEGSTENHEYQEEYIMKDNIDERGDAGGNESHASMNEYESKEGEPMSIDDPAETDPDENGDETEEDKDDLQEDVYSEGKNRPKVGLCESCRMTKHSKRTLSIPGLFNSLLSKKVIVFFLCRY